MLKSRSIWLVVLISIIAVAFIVSGCAKKQVVREEAAAKPVMEAKAPPAPPPAPAPKEEVAPAPAPAPKAEAAPPALAPEALNLKGLTIWFAFDDNNLSTKSKENLEKIANWMSKNTSARIQVQGHTCNLGTAEYNMALGQQRALRAKKYIEGLGVNASRVSTVSYGMEKPMVPNTNEANRSKNRRDEFVETK